MDPRDRWTEKHSEENGHYACLAGFEEDIRQYKDQDVRFVYEGLGVYDRIALFGFVIWIGLAISWIFFHGVKPPIAG